MNLVQTSDDEGQTHCATAKRSRSVVDQKKGWPAVSTPKRPRQNLQQNRVSGDAEPISVSSENMAWYNGEGVPILHRAQTRTHSHTTDNLELAVTLNSMSLYGRKPEYPEKTHQSRREHENSKHTGSKAGFEPSTREVRGYSTLLKSSAGQYNGLKNQGATCYLNSVLQCLYMTKEFREEVEKFEIDQQNSDKESADLMQELQKLFVKLNEADATTEGIIRCLCISNVREQQDAVEYYQKTLKVIEPHVSKIFKGEMSNKTKCLSCYHIFQENNPFFTIPLSIESEPSEQFSVDKGLNNFFKKVRLDEDNLVYCELCDQKVEAETWTEIAEVPTILTLYLKRFHFDYSQMRLVKNDCYTHIALEVEISNYKYELYAVINHMGGRSGGHYNAVIRPFNNNGWYCFDDSVVREELETSFQFSKLPYLLMYRKMGVPLSDENSSKSSSPGEVKEVPGYQHNQLKKKNFDCLEQLRGQMDFGEHPNEVEAPMQMADVPKKDKKSYDNEERAQTEMALLNVRAIDLSEKGKQNIEHDCSGKSTNDTVTEEFFFGLEPGDKHLSPERAITVKYISKDLNCINCIAGVYVEATKEWLSIYQAKKKNIITASTALQLLEVQAATGNIIDPSSNQTLTVNKALEKEIVPSEFKTKLLFAEHAVTGYNDPYCGKISLIQAIMKDRILESHGVRLLKAQIATGGIIDTVGNRRLPVEMAYERNLLNEYIYRILTNPLSDTKGFIDPNTNKNLTYTQLKKQCIIHPETRLAFIILKYSGTSDCK